MKAQDLLSKSIKELHEIAKQLKISYYKKYGKQDLAILIEAATEETEDEDVQVEVVSFETEVFDHEFEGETFETEEVEKDEETEKPKPAVKAPKRTAFKRKSKDRRVIVSDGKIHYLGEYFNGTMPCTPFFSNVSGDLRLNKRGKKIEAEVINENTLRFNPEQMETVLYHFNRSGYELVTE